MWLELGKWIAGQLEPEHRRKKREAAEAAEEEVKEVKRLSKSDYKAFAAKRIKRRRLYKKSIEKWQPGTGVIFCPKCGTKNEPLAQVRADESSRRKCCWPFCCLSCLCPTPEKEYLHCRMCFSFLGVYDRYKWCVRPNKQFVNDEQIEETKEKTFEKKFIEADCFQTFE